MNRRGFITAIGGVIATACVPLGKSTEKQVLGFRGDGAEMFCWKNRYVGIEGTFMFWTTIGPPFCLCIDNWLYLPTHDELDRVFLTCDLLVWRGKRRMWFIKHSGSAEMPFFVEYAGPSDGSEVVRKSELVQELALFKKIEGNNK